MRGRKSRFAVLLLFVILLTGCGKQGKADEGVCRCVITLETVPGELSYISEELLKSFEVTVSMKNLITEKSYAVTLNGDNNYSAELYLNPGEYRILSCYSSLYGLAVLSVDTRQELISLSYEQDGAIDVYIDNYEAYTQWVNRNVAAADILYSDKFSRSVQMNGEMTGLDDLLQKYTFTTDSGTETVQPYKEIYVYNSDYGITLTLQNQSAEALPYSQCKLIGVIFTGNHVVLGGGVRLGMGITAVSHSETGIYGLPDYCTGTALIGLGYDTTNMVYVDELSGDRLTLTYHHSRNYVTRISYEYAVFE